MDDHYPVRSSFSLLNKVLDEYEKNFGDSWKTVVTDSKQSWPYLDEALTKYQDPAEADMLLKLQRELDETKIILHKTIDSVLERGEKLDSLVEKSADLTFQSRTLSTGRRSRPTHGHGPGVQYYEYIRTYTLPLVPTLRFQAYIWSVVSFAYRQSHTRIA